MSLVKSLIIDKKILEAEEEVDKILEDAGVEPGSLVQRIEFEKGIYENTDQVRDFLDSHFIEARVDENDKRYNAVLFDEVAFVKDMMKKIKIRDGVFIVVGILKPVSPDNPIFFELPTEENIKLSDDIPYLIELATVVDGFHANYGQVKITKKDLISFRDNFDNNVVGIEISLDFDHETREAAGWLKDVFLSEDGNTLLGVVRWTPKGAQSLSDREFRYFSPEFHLNYVHPHTGKSHGPTLLGGALVNRAFLKMDAIVGLKERLKRKEVNNMDTIALSEHNNKVTQLNNEIEALKLGAEKSKGVLESQKSEIAQLSEQVKTLTEEKEKAAKEAEYNKLFSENKINKAQLDALKEGKDMMEVLSLSEKLNDKPQGTIQDGKPVNEYKLSEEEKAACKLYGLTEEDYIKANNLGGN